MMALLSLNAEKPEEGNLEWGEEVINVSELVVDHQGEHTHLGGTSLVQFNGTLGQLGISIERVPAKVKGAVTEITNKFVFASGILHDSKFKQTNEEEDLQGAGNWDGERGIPARSKVRELGSRVVNVTWEVDAGLVDKVSDNSKHADTPVLDFNISETVELGLVTVGNKAKGIEETKRSLGTELVLESHVGGDRRTGRLLGRSKSNGGGDEGGSDDRLHFDYLFVCSFVDSKYEKLNFRVLFALVDLDRPRLQQTMLFKVWKIPNPEIRNPDILILRMISTETLYERALSPGG
jgi:hypothetical protein